MIEIFEKVKKLWGFFWEIITKSFNKEAKDPIETNTQPWRDTTKINLLGIFVDKLNNLCNTQATFDVKSDSTQTERLKELCTDLEKKRFDIIGGMLADGDFYVFPATNSRGEIVHSYLSQQQVRIVRTDGGDIREAYGIIDWYKSKNNRWYFLLRHHVLGDNGTLTVSYSIVDENFRTTDFGAWAEYKDLAFSFEGAGHIGFGRYKSPISDRGLSPVYGVPLNFGCGEIEKKIFHDLELIDSEFENGKSVIFTDPRNLLKDEDRKKYRIAENIIPIQQRAGQTGNNIDIFNPNLRQSEHYSKLIADMALYEKEVGTSKGILTDNETSYTATATAVKRANADTLALLDRIRASVDDGNLMTLEADAVFLNIARDLWSYTSDWYDPFEDPAEQWKRLIEAKNNGAAEISDLIHWQFPNLTDEEIDQKMSRISQGQQANTDEALERILNGGNI